MTIKSVKAELKIKAPSLEIIEHKTSTASVEEAALAHKVRPGQILKTIALMVNKPILLMMAGDMKIDNKKYKEYFKIKAKMLSYEETERFTSHPIGGVCPFGLPSKIDIYSDISLIDYDIVIPAAGSRNSSVKIERKHLIDIVNAIQIDVSVKK
jgi:prolyl-tRNA editing enzyme YbaK/EbsC (Cys-tRNA(Pro) deacylase)